MQIPVCIGKSFSSSFSVLEEVKEEGRKMVGGGEESMGKRGFVMNFMSFSSSIPSFTL